MMKNRQLTFANNDESSNNLRIEYVDMQTRHSVPYLIQRFHWCDHMIWSLINWLLISHFFHYLQLTVMGQYWLQPIPEMKVVLWSLCSWIWTLFSSDIILLKVWEGAVYNSAACSFIAGLQIPVWGVLISISKFRSAPH